jgi:hypothetical protein
METITLTMKEQKRVPDYLTGMREGAKIDSQGSSNYPLQWTLEAIMLDTEMPSEPESAEGLSPGVYSLFPGK